jgi:uncharacterized protein involved in exopolysaccharide biosynthesis
MKRSRRIMFWAICLAVAVCGLGCKSGRADRMAQLETKVAGLETRLAAAEASALESENNSLKSELLKERAEVTLELIDLHTRYTANHPQIAAKQKALTEIDGELARLQ